MTKKYIVAEIASSVSAPIEAAVGQTVHTRRREAKSGQKHHSSIVSLFEKKSSYLRCFSADTESLFFVPSIAPVANPRRRGVAP